MSNPDPTTENRAPAIWLVIGFVSALAAFVTAAEDATVAGAFVSRPLWITLVSTIGTGPTTEQPDFASLNLTVVAIGTAVILAAMTALLRLRGLPWARAATVVGKVAGVLGLWVIALYACLITGWTSGYAIIAGIVDLVFASCLAVWLAALLAPSQPSSQTPAETEEKQRQDVTPRTAGVILAGLCLAYMVPFVWMNWGQYWNLRTPHGDSAMYEEHLWNLLHGKGFRSYLDQGLFLGEHIQVAHLLLIPVYVLFPSHLTLEFFESLALASAAVPTFLIAARHSGSRRIGLWIAAAVLLYAPLHYLDIEIDRKSFRPICFGVPAMLWAFHFLETGRWKRFVLMAILALSAKEDYALILGPLGIWYALTNWPTTRQRLIGVTIAIAAGVYLFLTVKFIIPWFRSGDPVHYARYFSQFGETPLGILWGMLTKPGVLFASLVTPATTLYVLRLLVPLAMTPLLSPSRLLVGVPILGLLLLNQLSLDPPSPVHHFHAPLVPVLLWAMAAGIGPLCGDRAENRDPLISRLMRWDIFELQATPVVRCRLVVLPLATALATGITLSFSPVSIAFWDSGRPTYWASVYVPNERAAEFEKVLAVVPPTSRVASTDYIHPRLTHYERSYDYSGYVRKVAGYEDRVPADTEYIILDVRGPYSEIRGPESIRELRDQPSEWSVVSVDTRGYFIVLKRHNNEDNDNQD